LKKTQKKSSKNPARLLELSWLDTTEDYPRSSRIISMTTWMILKTSLTIC